MYEKTDWSLTVILLNLRVSWQCCRRCWCLLIPDILQWVRDYVFVFETSDKKNGHYFLISATKTVLYDWLSNLFPIVWNLRMSLTNRINPTILENKRVLRMMPSVSNGPTGNPLTFLIPHTVHEHFEREQNEVELENLALTVLDAKRDSR